MEPWKYDSARDLELRTRDSLKSVRREVGLITTFTGALRWMIIRVYLRCYHRWLIHGREHLPRQLPFILVANHTSHLDALILAAALPPKLNRLLFPIAAGDTFFETRPAAAFAALFMNALPLWRHRCTAHSLEDLRARLATEHCGYIIFPEGTRSRDGLPGRFKPGIGMLVAETNVPVVPCHIRGAHEALPPDRVLPRPVKIVVSVGKALEFHRCPNTREGWSQVAAELQEAVAHCAVHAKV